MEVVFGPMLAVVGPFVIVCVAVVFGIFVVKIFDIFVAVVFAFFVAVVFGIFVVEVVGLFVFGNLLAVVVGPGVIVIFGPGPDFVVLFGFPVILELDFVAFDVLVFCGVILWLFLWLLKYRETSTCSNRL